MIGFFLWFCNFVAVPGFLAILAAWFVARGAVPGSYPRYKAVTVIVTLCWPVIAASAVLAVVGAMDGAMFTTAMDILRIVFVLIDWHEFKDDDNWWKGRGKKMLDAIDKAIGKLSPAAVGAGA